MNSAPRTSAVATATVMKRFCRIPLLAIFCVFVQACAYSPTHVGYDECAAVRDKTIVDAGGTVEQGKSCFCSDDECPPGTVCLGRLFSNSCEPAKICTSDAECPSEQECRLRDGAASLIGPDDPGPTRATCEPRPCQCDAECPWPSVCGSVSLGGSPGCHAAWPCAVDTDCAPPEYCAVGGDPSCPDQRRVCRLRPCRCDDDCPAKQYCQAPILWGGSPMCLEGTSRCSTNADCAPNETCAVNAQSATGSCPPERLHPICTSQ
jgi:hypothetical protein